ncbi:MAG TPA: acetate/propionate family kinase [Deltaproteobacteria bacterium]|nr:acetate/propionate family kinase [Deltaproteobacteria bacterium]HXK48091.1 acetate/propionate family kinase [Deltaproteobacteria bacterium]
MDHHILCINSGSSSMKFALYRLDSHEDLIAEGAAERIGLPEGWLWLADGSGRRLADRHMHVPDHREAVRLMFSLVMEELHLPAPDGVGHRVVHGGPKHMAPEMVTPELMITLRKLIPLAPLHLPSEIRGIDAVAGHYPGLSQVVCFDTAFHRSIPEVAQRLPLVRSLWHEGVHRYGFHGLSYEYIVNALGAERKGRVIIAHLGNGASMAALKDGKPQDTTMGFSALGGLMMGTRCGDLDPGILLYLMDEKGYDARQLERLLDQRSGLMGVSGISSDMKTLLDKRSSEPHAAQAVELFCYTSRKFVGALSAVLGGLDTLVFTGGIGERAAPVRWMICHGLEYLGIRLDPSRNDAHEEIISSGGSPCTVRVIPTNEDLMIARHTRALLFRGKEGNSP